MDILESLKNFNLIKYTDWYALTVDMGGRPIIFQGEHLDDVLRELKIYLDKVQGPDFMELCK